jgi:DNA-binding transcriptional MocR family regulator
LLLSTLVNVIFVTMTNWLPDIFATQGPRYLAIAAVIEADRAAGRLEAGERLPTHRELAWRLGVTVGTVTRAYAEAQRRGLIAGEVGRGTFVRGPARDSVAMPIEPRRASEGTDFGFASPPALPEDREIMDHLAALAREPASAALLGYQPNLGTEAARAAGAEWLARHGVIQAPENLAVTAGAQHAIMLTLAALAQSGDRVLCEELTYPGFFAVCRFLGLRPEGLSMDRHGLDPAALEQALSQRTYRALYTIPTLQNPTTITQPPERRAAIVEICRRHGLAIIEDDIFAQLSKAPSTLHELAPELTVHLTSLSKSLAPGLRIGYVAFPKALAERIALAMQATTVMAAPILAALCQRLITDGTAGRLVRRRGEEVARRAQRFREYLAPHGLLLPEGSIHAWLPLPEPWRANDFAEAARRRQVIVRSADRFSLARQVQEHAVRLCLGPPSDMADLTRGLEGLKEMLDTPPLSSSGSFI